MYIMDDRKTLLGRLAVGDVFHARRPNGPSLICLTVSVTEAVIQARRVTTQESFEFDRQTGVEKCDDQRESRIDSVAPLPVAVLNVILGIDRKFRLEQDPERHKLTDAEIKALMYTGPHYASNPL
jgi:hypothetical protein